MNYGTLKAVGALCVLSLACGYAGAQRVTSGEFHQASAVLEAPSTARVVVRFKPQTLAQASKTQGVTTREAVAGLSKTLSVAFNGKVTPSRIMGTGAALFTSAQMMSTQEAQALAIELQSNPLVQSAELDVPVFPMQSNDSYAQYQWPLYAANRVAGGAGFFSAWSRSTGANVVVAVLDTGSLPHPELSGKELPGYDFISDTLKAGDGDGRDADPTDVGDFCASPSKTSSWHGTAVASQIAAVTNNGYGIAGAAPNVRVMHARVLGRCGGWLSDTADAISWASGVPLAGVPAPSQRPQVLNLSLGSVTSCTQYMQDALNQAAAAGVTVVAATGNNGTSTVHAPANCSGVIAVGAHTASGDMAQYSNYSAQVTLTAPGGGTCKTQTGTACVSTATYVAGVSGDSVFGGFTEVRSFIGTSAATPHVAAAAALLKAYDPSLTPAAIKGILVASARAHPAGTFCSTPGRCGAGMLDVEAAFARMTGAPTVSVAYGEGITRSVASSQDGLVRPGGTGTLVATVTGSAASYSWRQTSGPAAVIVSGQGSTTMTFRAPAESGVLGFELRATGNNGAGTGTIAVRANYAPVLDTAPLPKGKSTSAYSYQYSTKDLDGDALTYMLNSAPAGLTVSAAGAMSWARPVIGTHNVRLSVRDAWGQQESVTRTLVIEDGNTAPTVPGGAFTATANISFSGNLAIRDAEGGVLTYSAVGMPAGMSITGAGALSWSRPVAGSYTIVVSARDSGGLVGTGSYSVVVREPNVGPSIANAAFDATTVAPFAAKVTASDANGDALTYAFSSMPPGMVGSNDGSLQWNRPTKGKFLVRVVAKDPAGLSATGTMTVNVTEPNVAPVVTSAQYSLEEGANLRHVGRAVDANGDKLTWSLSGAPAGASIASNGVVTWPRVTTGSYAMTMIARDPLGLEGRAQLNVVVTQKNVSPEIAAQTITATVGKPVSYKFSARDRNGDLLVYSASGIPAGSSMAPDGTFSWPTPANGTWAFTVKVQDPKGLSAQARMVVKGSYAPQAPVVTLTEAKGTVGTPLTHRLAVSDINNDAIVLSLEGAQAGMTVSSNFYFKWTNPVAGVHTVTVVARDSTGLVSRTPLRISVIQPNRAPSIVAPSSYIVNQGRPLTAQPLVSDPDGDSMTLRLVSAPTGVTINSQTGLIRWDAPRAGSYAVVVEVKDARGASATTRFSIRVNP